jgi:hypothetical protein
VLRLGGAFGILLLGPLVLLIFPSQTLALLFTAALIGGAALIANVIAQVARAYLRFVRRRIRRSGSAGRVRRGVVVGAWLAGGVVAAILLLPAYLILSSIGGMLDGGASSVGGGSRDVIPLTGFVALAIVAFLVLVAPLVGLVYLALTVALYWLHRTRLRIDDRPTAIGVGGLIDWLERDRAAS